MANVQLGGASVYGGSDDGIWSDEDLTAAVQVMNEDDQTANVGLSFQLSDGQSHEISFEVAAGETQWAQWPIGSVAAGGYDLTVYGSVDTGVSTETAGETGYSFHVQERDTGPAIPVVELDHLSVRAVSNVDHEDGVAWVGEDVTVSVHVENVGATASGPVDVTVWCSDGQQTAQQVSLEPGGTEWVQLLLTGLAAGTYEVHASAGAELEDSSQALGHLSGTLTVSAAAEGWVQADVSVAIQDFLGRPLSGYHVFLRFYAMDGTEAFGGETIEATESSAGIVGAGDLRIPQDGRLVVQCVSSGEPGPLLESNQLHYTLDDGDTTLTATGKQGSDPASARARSLAEATEKLGLEGSAGISWSVIEIGGSASSESGERQVFEEEVEFSFKVALSNIALALD